MIANLFSVILELLSIVRGLPGTVLIQASYDFEIQNRHHKVGRKPKYPGYALPNDAGLVSAEIPHTDAYL